MSRQPDVAKPYGPAYAYPLLIIAVGAALYARTLSYGFYYDDTQAIVTNPAIRTLGRAATSFLVGNATTSLDTAPGYRPFTVVSYALDYAIGGGAPWAYHLTNLIVILATALLTFALATGVGLSAIGALLAAVTTLVHPLAVEAVAYPSARSSLMATLGIVASLTMIRRSWVTGSLRWYAGALIAAAAACLSKESAVVLPALAWCATSPRLSSGISADLKRRVLWVTPLAVVVCAYVVVRGIVAPLPAPSMNQTGIASTMIGMAGEYVRLLVVPIGLTIDHPMPTGSETALALIWVLGAAAVAWLVGRRVPQAAFGAWMVAWSLLPNFALAVSTRVALIQEHRALLAVVGFGIAVAAGAGALSRSATILNRQRIAGLVAGLLLLTYSVLSWNRISVWAAEETLWEDAAAKFPTSGLAHTWLGTFAARQGRVDQAIEELDMAARLDPRSVFAEMEIARLQHARGNRQGARAAYLKTLGANPRYAQALAGLGLLAQEEGDWATALSLYRAVLAVEPRDLATRNNLATIFLSQGQYEAARDGYRMILAIDPDQPRVLTNLGVVYLKLNEDQAAETALRRAAQLNPTDVRTAWYLGQIAAQRGQWADAEAYWRQAAVGMPEAAITLARFYERGGRMTDAVEAYRRVLNLAPDTPAYAALRTEASQKIPK